MNKKQVGIDFPRHTVSEVQMAPTISIGKENRAENNVMLYSLRTRCFGCPTQRFLQ